MPRKKTLSPQQRLQEAETLISSLLLMDADANCFSKLSPPTREKFQKWLNKETIWPAVNSRKHVVQLPDGSLQEIPAVSIAGVPKAAILNSTPRRTNQIPDMDPALIPPAPPPPKSKPWDEVLPEDR